MKMTDNNPAFSDEAQRTQVELSHGYHRPQFQETMDTMGILRDGFKRLAHDIVTNVPSSRERSLALTALDEGNMWAIAALARHEPTPEGGGSPNTTSHPKRSGDAPLPPVMPGGGVGPSSPPGYTPPQDEAQVTGIDMNAPPPPGGW